MKSNFPPESSTNKLAAPSTMGFGILRGMTAAIFRGYIRVLRSNAHTNHPKLHKVKPPEVRYENVPLADIDLNATQLGEVYRDAVYCKQYSGCASSFLHFYQL